MWAIRLSPPHIRVKRNNDLCIHQYFFRQWSFSSYLFLSDISSVVSRGRMSWMIYFIYSFFKFSFSFSSDCVNNITYIYILSHAIKIICSKVSSFIGSQSYNINLSVTVVLEIIILLSYSLSLSHSPSFSLSPCIPEGSLSLLCVYLKGLSPFYVYT